MLVLVLFLVWEHHDSNVMLFVRKTCSVFVERAVVFLKLVLSLANRTAFNLFCSTMHLFPHFDLENTPSVSSHSFLEVFPFSILCV